MMPLKKLKSISAEEFKTSAIKIWNIFIEQKHIPKSAHDLLLKNINRIVRGIALPLLSISTIASSMTLDFMPPPQSVTNACAIFKEYPQWLKDTKKAQEKWGIPVSTQLAIMQQESQFKAESRPYVSKDSNKLASSATGYSQALRKTWNHYLAANNKVYGDPRNFADSADFIGWYAHEAHRDLGISVQNTRALYLAYHEGAGGYKSRGYLKHPWIQSVANKVDRQARVYQSQLSRCEPTAS